MHLSERIVGRLRRASSGATSFAYVGAWREEHCASISRGLPLRVRAYVGDAAFSFFGGLSPDAEAVKTPMSANPAGRG